MTTELERLKAENASLLESLRAARHEGITVPWEATPEQMAFIESLVSALRSALAAAEQRAEAAEKERDDLRAAATVHFEEAGKLAGWKAKAMLRLIELEPVHDELDAAEKRASDLGMALGDLRAGVDEHGFSCEVDGTTHRNLAGAFGPENCPMCMPTARAALHDEERPQEEEK